MTTIAFRRPLSTAEAAEMLGLAANTLRQWRVTGIGPRSYKLGRKTVVYDLDDIAAWVSEQKAKSSAPARH